jgi:hypothetical protein
MIPRNYYVAPLAAFKTLQGIKWEAVLAGAGLHVGHIDFCGDSASQSSFEAQPGVVRIGTLFDQAIPPAIAAALQSHGVLTTDSAFSAIQKVVNKLGGVAIHY